MRLQALRANRRRAAARFRARRSAGRRDRRASPRSAGIRPSVWSPPLTIQVCSASIASPCGVAASSAQAHHRFVIAHQRDRLVGAQPARPRRAPDRSRRGCRRRGRPGRRAGRRRAARRGAARAPLRRAARRADRCGRGCRRWRRFRRRRRRRAAARNAVRSRTMGTGGSLRIRSAANMRALRRRFPAAVARPDRRA